MSIINIFMDTNILPREPSKFDNVLLKRLCTLSESKILQIYLSEVVGLEWKTQLKEKMEEDVKTAIAASHQLKKNSWFNELDGSYALNEADNYLKKVLPEIQNIVERKVGATLKDMSANIVPIKEHHGCNVINDYFNGNPPFKDAKSREDFPDSFIYQCVKDLVSKKDFEIQCITADKNLESALLTLTGVSVHKSIYDFLQSKTTEEITKKLKVELRWRKTFANLKPTLPKLKGSIKKMLETKLVDEVTHKYVEHPEIPSDDNEALIDGIYEIIDLAIEWNGIKNIGPQIITVPFSITCDADLEFPVYHMNAYNVPDGVHVSYGDHEEDYYFYASGRVTLQIDGIASLEFDTEEEGDELPDLIDIQLEEMEIRIVQKGFDGSIF